MPVMDTTMPIPSSDDKGTREPGSLFGETEGETRRDNVHEFEYSKSRSSKFRFKSSRSHRKNDSVHRNDNETRYYESTDRESNHHRRRHHHHRSHHSSKRQKTDPTTATSTSPSYNNNDNEQRRSLSPETAFRESLFDALGDDEGASYWESVYGQPIHTYAVPSVPKGPNGELEQMTEEEYASYVRSKMWERSHEGMMEERERQRREKAKAKAKAKKRSQEDGRRTAHEEEDRARFHDALDESLQRGEKRRRAKVWKAAWEKYLKSWEELAALSSSSSSSKTSPAEAPAQATGEEGNGKQFYIRNHIHWPVESGKRRDISREAVREFMQHYHPPTAAAAATRASSMPQDKLLSTIIKAERIRWHPDKMLHRYGSLGLGDEKGLVQSVTQVFQILDDLWIEERDRK